jgi:hypothetical protein
MPPAVSSIRYSEFRQAARRFRTSDFLQALAQHTTQLDPLVHRRDKRDVGRWPWVASAMARESLHYSNEYRHGGTPTEANFARLYNLFDAADDSSHSPLNRRAPAGAL